MPGKKLSGAESRKRKKEFENASKMSSQCINGHFLKKN